MAEPLKRIGYFAELLPGAENLPSLRDSMRDTADPDEEDLVSYLKAGALLATTGQLVGDVLAADDRPVGMLATLTDGVWMWPAVLAYYVETYHVRLPQEFVEHASTSGWTPRLLTDTELIEAAGRALAISPMTERLRELLAEVKSVGRAGVVDLGDIERLLLKMIATRGGPDFRSALASRLREQALNNPVLGDSDLGRRLADIQPDYERASFDRLD